MDIQVASNFERYIYYLTGQNAIKVGKLMRKFTKEGKFNLRDMGAIRPDPLFATGSADNVSTLAEIRRCYRENKYILDPHTAVGAHVARRFLDEDEPMICLATAHPAKFSEAIRLATGRDLARHEILDALNGRPVRRTVLPASEQVIREFMEEKIGAGG